MHVVEVMSTDEAAALRRRVDSLEFGDGKRTALGLAQEQKQNTQSTRRTDDRTPELLDEVTNRLATHDRLRHIAFPKTFIGVRFSRYGPGDHYGLHVDQALMGRPPHGHRSDLSFTLFLSEPAEYDGGELRLASATGTPAVRLPAGQMVVYPTHQLHEVATVTRGERLVCVGWIESWIPDPQLRDILTTLDAAQTALADEGASVLSRTMLHQAWEALARYGAR